MTDTGLDKTGRAKANAANTGMVDPVLRAALALVPNFDSLDSSTLAAFRTAMTAEPVVAGLQDGCQVDHVTAVGDDGHGVAGLLYRPATARPGGGVVLVVHGGGYVLGSAAREHPYALALARALDCVVLNLDYRLAPEHPFPAAADDCLAALEWLHREHATLDIDPARIVVRGISAGGGLAAGLALRARARGNLPIALLQLIYPMLDDRCDPPAHVGEHVWTRRANLYGWASLLGDAAYTAPSFAVPAREADLSGLPPTFMAVGDIDLFVSENLAFAARLSASGVPLELHVYPGAYHGFNLIPGAAPAQAFDAASHAALSRVLKAGT